MESMFFNNNNININNNNISPERPVSPVSSASSAEVTAGHDISTNNRTLDISYFQDDNIGLIDLGLKHWIRVTQLDPSTTSKNLKYMFYPHGGDEAFVLWDNGVIGYVGFENKCMAEIGVEKMHAFIPCRQTQALCVHHVNIEEVILAKSTAPFSNQKGLISLLYSNCPVKFIAHVIQSYRQPCDSAQELAEAVKRAPTSTLSRVLNIIMEVKNNWSALEEFRESLLCHLLQYIMEKESTDIGSNCGTLLGQLFLNGFLTGDPFLLSLRMLQHGVHCIAHIDNICTITHICANMPFPISKASFWAMIGQISLQIKDPLRAALRQHLRQFQQSTDIFSSMQSITPKNSWSVTKTTSINNGYSNTNTIDITNTNTIYNNCNIINDHIPQFLPESKSRTVYISRLPPLLPQQHLMELLMMCGNVNKVRVCRGNGYSTLFAFVEMSNAEEAKSTIRLSRISLLGCSIRVQIARNPIQDAQSEDAILDNDNNIIIRNCVFGQCGGTLAEAAAIGGKIPIR